MAETENTSIINTVETENTSTASIRTQLINLEGLNTFMEESIKIFEPTLPEGTDGQYLHAKKFSYTLNADYGEGSK